MEPGFGDFVLEHMLAEWRAELYIERMDALNNKTEANRTSLRADMERYINSEPPRPSLQEELKRHFEKEDERVDGAAETEGSSKADPQQ
jgi:hypothetical protein